MPISIDQVAPLTAGQPVSVRIDLPADRYLVALHSGSRSIPFRLSESLEQGRRSGAISWIVRDPRELRYQAVLSDKRPVIDDRPPIGLGDAFHYNRPGGFDPLTVGMKNDQAIAVDWDGDGRTDLLQRNIYSTAFGEPWWGLYFARNIGTNAAPRFDRSVRLATAEDPYASYQLVDWNGDGRLDVLTGVGSGRERGVLKVYLRTSDGGLAAGPRIDAPPSDFTYGMRLFDWTRDLFTLRMRVQYFPTPEQDTTLYRHAREGAGFGAAQPVALGGKTVYDEWPSASFDFNLDGQPDLIGSTRGLDTAVKPPRTCIVGWESAVQPAQCLIDVSPDGFAIPAAARTPAFNGLLVSHMSGWLRYFAQTGANRWAEPQLITARGMPISSGGYSSVEVADWEGDGDLDFIAGNETGFVQLIENISTPKRTMFATARVIAYAARWQFIDDADPERPLGQSKPAYVDWDGDGDLDLLVGNNSNRIAYFENFGTRRSPRFAAQHRTLMHDGGEHFSFRARPAPVDWNGDGLIDLVAGYAGARNRNDAPSIAICVYLRYRDPATGALRLRAGEPLRDTNGAELRTPIPYHHGFEAVDWDADGDLDIIASERSHLVLYRREAAGFRREPMLFQGKPLTVSHHETSAKAVDWDRDGQLDLIAGGESGWVYYFHRSSLGK